MKKEGIKCNLFRFLKILKWIMFISQQCFCGFSIVKKQHWLSRDFEFWWFLLVNYFCQFRSVEWLIDNALVHWRQCASKTWNPFEKKSLEDFLMGKMQIQVEKDSLEVDLDRAPLKFLPFVTSFVRAGLKTVTWHKRHITWISFFISPLLSGSDGIDYDWF